MRRETQINKVISVILTFAMLLSLFQVTAAAETVKDRTTYENATLVFGGFEMQGGENGQIQAFVTVTLKNGQAPGFNFRLNYDPKILVPSDYDTNAPLAEPISGQPRKVIDPDTGEWKKDRFGEGLYMPSTSAVRKNAELTDLVLEEVLMDGFSDIHGCDDGETADASNSWAYFHIQPDRNKTDVNRNSSYIRWREFEETDGWFDDYWEIPCLVGTEREPLMVAKISFCIVNPQEFMKYADQSPYKLISQDDNVLYVWPREGIDTDEDPDDHMPTISYVKYDEDDVPQLAFAHEVDYDWNVKEELVDVSARYSEIDLSSYNIYYEGKRQGDRTDLIEYLNKYYGTVLLKWSDTSYTNGDITWGEENSDFKITAVYPDGSEEENGYDPKGNVTYKITQGYPTLTQEELDGGAEYQRYVSMTVNVRPVSVIGFKAEPQSKYIVMDDKTKDDIVMTAADAEKDNNYVSMDIPVYAEPILDETIDTYIAPHVKLADKNTEQDTWENWKWENEEGKAPPEGKIKNAESYEPPVTETFTYEVTADDMASINSAPWLTNPYAAAGAELYNIEITRTAGTSKYQTKAPVNDDDDPDKDEVKARVIPETGEMQVKIKNLDPDTVGDPDDPKNTEKNPEFKIYLPNGMVIDSTDDIVDITFEPVPEGAEPPDSYEAVVKIDPTKGSDKFTPEELKAIEGIINLGSDEYYITKKDPPDEDGNEKYESEKTQFSCAGRINYYIGDREEKRGSTDSSSESPDPDESPVPGPKATPVPDKPPEKRDTKGEPPNRKYVEVNYSEGFSGLFVVKQGYPVNSISTYLEFPYMQTIETAYDGLSGISGAALGAAKVEEWWLEDVDGNKITDKDEDGNFIFPERQAGDISDPTFYMVGKLAYFEYTNFGRVWNARVWDGDKDTPLLDEFGDKVRWSDEEGDNVFLKMKVTAKSTDEEYKYDQQIKVSTQISESYEFEIQNNTVYHFDTMQEYNGERGYTEEQRVQFDIENIGTQDVNGLTVTIENVDDSASSKPVFVLDQPITPSNLGVTQLGELPEKASFVIRNSVGLPARDEPYEAWVTVRSNLADASKTPEEQDADYLKRFKVSFMVTEDPVYRVIVHSTIVEKLTRNYEDLEDDDSYGRAYLLVPSLDALGNEVVIQKQSSTYTLNELENDPEVDVLAQPTSGDYIWTSWLSDPDAYEEQMRLRNGSRPSLSANERATSIKINPAWVNYPSNDDGTRSEIGQINVWATFAQGQAATLASTELYLVDQDGNEYYPTDERGLAFSVDEENYTVRVPYEAEQVLVRYKPRTRPNTREGVTTKVDISYTGDYDGEYNEGTGVYSTNGDYTTVNATNADPDNGIKAIGITGDDDEWYISDLIDMKNFYRAEYDDDGTLLEGQINYMRVSSELTEEEDWADGGYYTYRKQYKIKIMRKPAVQVDLIPGNSPYGMIAQDTRSTGINNALNNLTTAQMQKASDEGILEEFTNENWQKLARLYFDKNRRYCKNVSGAELREILEEEKAKNKDPVTDVDEPPEATDAPPSSDDDPAETGEPEGTENPEDDSGGTGSAENPEDDSGGTEESPSPAPTETLTPEAEETSADADSDDPIIHDDYEYNLVPWLVEKTENTYYSEDAWIDKDYDKDEEVIFITRTDTFVDSGYKNLRKTNGDIVYPSDITRYIEVEVFNDTGTVTDPAKHFRDDVADEKARIEIPALTPNQGTGAILTNSLRNADADIRPGVYTMVYEFNDSDDLKATFKRPVIILAEKGDINLSKNFIYDIDNDPNETGEVGEVEDKDGTSAADNDAAAVYRRFITADDRNFLKDFVRQSSGFYTGNDAVNAAIFAYRTADVNEDSHINTNDADMIMSSAYVRGLRIDNPYYDKLRRSPESETYTRQDVDAPQEMTPLEEKAELVFAPLNLGNSAGGYSSNNGEEVVSIDPGFSGITAADLEDTAKNILWVSVGIRNPKLLTERFTGEGISSLSVGIDYNPDYFVPAGSEGTETEAAWESAIRNANIYNAQNVTFNGDVFFDAQLYSLDSAATTTEYAPVYNDALRETTLTESQLGSMKTAYISVKAQTVNMGSDGYDEVSSGGKVTQNRRKLKLSSSEEPEEVFLLRIPFKVKSSVPLNKTAILQNLQLNLSPQTFTLGSGDNGVGYNTVNSSGEITSQTGGYGYWERRDKTNSLRNLKNFFDFDGAGEEYLDSMKLVVSGVTPIETPDPYTDNEYLPYYDQDAAAEQQTKWEQEQADKEAKIGTAVKIYLDPDENEETDFIPSIREYYATVPNDVNELSFELTPTNKKVTLSLAVQATPSPSPTGAEESGESAETDDTGGTDDETPSGEDESDTDEYTIPDKVLAINERDNLLFESVTHNIPFTTEKRIVNGNEADTLVSQGASLTEVNPSVLQPSVSDENGPHEFYGFSNVFYIEIEGSENPYIVRVRRYQKPRIRLGYGNMPAGMIYRDDISFKTEEEKAEALRLFDESDTQNKLFDPDHIPIVNKKKGEYVYPFNDAEQPYTAKAWGSYNKSKTKILINYDLDKYAFTMYQSKSWSDPGVFVINELGKESAAKASITAKLKMFDGYDGVPSYSTKYDDAADKVVDFDVEIDSDEKYNLKSMAIRPDVYVAHYNAEYEAITGEAISLQTKRILIVTTYLGDVYMTRSTAGLNSLDSNWLKTNATKINKGNTFFAFRIANVKHTPDPGVNSLDSNSLRTSVTTYFNKKKEDIKFYPDIVDFNN